MALDLISGSAFSGKNRFGLSRIREREAADAELGLIMLDFTGLYSSMFPGAQSALRDQAVSDSGAPLMTGYMFEVAVNQAAERELSGYIAVDSPRRAVALADRIGPTSTIFHVESTVTEIAQRAESHLTQLARTVPRASRASAVRRCREAALVALRERPLLVGRARSVTTRPGGRFEVGGPVAPFDRALFESGLSSRGREVLDDLRAGGVIDPTPAEILGVLLSERRRGL